MTVDSDINDIGGKNNSDRNSGRMPVRIGLWGWLGIYASGAILLFLISSHVWMVHYASSQPHSWSKTTEALSSPLVRTIEFSILIFALIHGTMGLRRVILDLEIFKRKGSRYLTLCLTIIAIVAFIWGIKIFTHLTSGI